ncbi:hypothetical protein ABQF08_15085, partial [Xanthomonas campestris pv. campestris]
MFKVISVSGLYRADTCAERDALNVRHSRALLSRVANAAPKVAHRALPYWIGDVCSERSLVREPIASCAYLVAPEKPPITQRPQGLDVCSGVPELP